MTEPYPHASIRGDMTMSRGFVAQYAAEAALEADGVAGLDTGSIVQLKEAFGLEHEGKGVRVVFREDKDNAVTITIFPIIYFGYHLPEVAWTIQERVKEDVEKYTGLSVEYVHVHVKGVVPREDGPG